MHPPHTGLRQAARWSTLRSLCRFERIYRDARFDMVTASSRFLQSLEIQVRRRRTWHCGDSPILFFSEHTSVWDGFLLAMVSDAGRDVRRVVFSPTAMLYGREFRRRNILVYPQIVWRKLLLECRTTRERLQYFLTHRPGPFAWAGPFKARRGENVAAICAALAESADVCLLPSGAIGYPRWCSGIGAVILAYQHLRLEGAPPLMLAPVYIQWPVLPGSHRSDRGNRPTVEVEIHAPVLISADELLHRAKQQLGEAQRNSLTEWMRSSYNRRDWPVDRHSTLAGAPSLHSQRNTTSRARAGT